MLAIQTFGADAANSASSDRALRTSVDAAFAQSLSGPKSPQALEERYQVDMQAERLRRLRLGALIGTVVYDLLLLTDTMVVPDVL